MAKNIESQGVRVGYIIGGILALLLAAFLTILYMPAFLSSAFGIPALWDLRETIAGIITPNFMDLFDTWGVVGILGIFFLLYFVCFAARPSKSATMFRLTGIFATLGLVIPSVAAALLIMAEIDLTAYAGYAVLALWVLSILFYILGLVFRAKQKFHKNKATTALVFCATFWVLLLTINTVYQVGATFGIEALTSALTPVISLINLNMFAILAIFLLIAGIWMLLTIPHHVRVEYNADTPNLKVDESGKPIVVSAENVTLTAEEEAAAKERSDAVIEQSGAPDTQDANVYPDKPIVETKKDEPEKVATPEVKKAEKVLPNPYRRKPIQPVPATPQIIQPQPVVQQGFAPSQQNYTQPRQVTQGYPQPQNACPQNNPQIITPQAPFNPMANTQYNQPRPAMPQQPMQQPIQPMARPMQQPMGQTQMQQPVQPMGMQQPMRPMRTAPMRPAMPMNPNMAPNNFMPRPMPNGQPYNPQNNPNNVIPNNLNRNNPNNPNGGM